MPGSGGPCIYCERPAFTEEHILATWLMDDLEKVTGRAALQGQMEYGNGLIVPVSVTTDGKGKHQFNLTSDTICGDCNSAWMNQVDERVRPYIRKLLRGQQVTTSGRMRKAIASWAVKTAITMRFAHVKPDPVEGEWAKQLLTDNSHLPSPLWHIWLARYAGKHDLWYRQGGFDIKGAVRIDGGPADDAPEFSDGVVMTLVVGQLCLQVLRINGPAFPLLAADGPARVAIWPDAPVASWPPPHDLDDSSLEGFANHFYGSPMAIAVQRPRPAGSPDSGTTTMFRTSVTQEMLASNVNYVLTIGYDCRCGTHTDVAHDTGGPLRDLRVPYTADVSYVCRTCGAAGGGKFTLAQIPTI